jgi:5-methylcytosine-specific restriction endonuclease McrA
VVNIVSLSTNSRICERCGAAFEPSPRGRPSKLCVSCRRTRGRAWKAAWRKANLDKARQQSRKSSALWRKANPDKARQQSRKSYALRFKANPDKERERARQTMRKLRAKDPERARAETRKHWRAWFERNKAKKAAEWRWRAEMLEKAPGGAFSWKRPDYQNRIRMFGGLCAYCGKKPVQELDHAIPLSRGGTNFACNIYPACKSCNSSKRNRKLRSEWTPPKNR